MSTDPRAIGRSLAYSDDDPSLPFRELPPAPWLEARAPSPVS